MCACVRVLMVPEHSESLIRLSPRVQVQNHKSVRLCNMYIQYLCLFAVLARADTEGSMLSQWKR